MAESEQNGRALRLDEQRDRRRNIAVTSSIVAVGTIALTFMAVTRLGGTAGASPRVEVRGQQATSTSELLLPLEPLSTSTTLFVLAPATTPTTVAPTTTSKPAATTAPSTTAASTTTSSTTTSSTTSTTRPPAPLVFWGVTPSSKNVESGEIVNVSVRATNYGNAAGSVMTPGCASPPQPAVPGGHGVCNQGSRTVSIAVGQTLTWNVKFWALSDSTSGGATLPPRDYTVRVGGATVRLHVT